MLDDSTVSVGNVTAFKRKLLVPRSRTVIRQRRAFSVAGPKAWNGLPVVLRLMPGAPRLYFSLVLRPHCLTEDGLGALLSRFPRRGAI